MIKDNSDKAVLWDLDGVIANTYHVKILFKNIFQVRHGSIKNMVILKAGKLLTFQQNLELPNVFQFIQVD